MILENGCCSYNQQGHWETDGYCGYHKGRRVGQWVEARWSVFLQKWHSTDSRRDLCALESKTQNSWAQNTESVFYSRWSNKFSALVLVNPTKHPRKSSNVAVLHCPSRMKYIFHTNIKHIWDSHENQTEILLDVTAFASPSQKLTASGDFPKRGKQRQQHDS